MHRIFPFHAMGNRRQHDWPQNLRLGAHALAGAGIAEVLKPLNWPKGPLLRLVEGLEQTQLSRPCRL